MALVLTWQDGFEGAENLTTVYGAGNVYGGAFIASGSGRGGGNALAASGSGVIKSTGATLPTDAVQIGIARAAAVGGNANIIIGDFGTPLATIQVSPLDDVTVILNTLTGSPTLTTSAVGLRYNNIWRYIEVYFVVGGGRLVVSIDGQTALDFSGTTTTIGHVPNNCTLGGSGAFLDDFYIGVDSAHGGPAFFTDYAITGTAPSASGSVPALGNARVDQQFIAIADVAPKSNARVDQQFIIIAIKNKPGAPVRPQVVGIGRTQ